MFELVKNRLYTNADNSTLLAVVPKPADRQTYCCCLPYLQDLALVQDWCNHWCMILNPNKIKALVVHISRTVNPPHGDLVLSGVSIALIPGSSLLAWNLTGSSPSKTMCVVLSSVFLKEFVFLGSWSVSLWTPLCCSLLLCNCSPNPWDCCPVWRSAAECHLQLLELQVYSVPKPLSEFLADV